MFLQGETVYFDEIPSGIPVECTISAIDFHMQEYHLVPKDTSAITMYRIEFNRVYKPADKPKGLNSGAALDLSQLNLPINHTSIPRILKCECGCDVVGAGKHSIWCPKYDKTA